MDRILRYAFELAMTRPAKRLTSATKSNGIIHTMPFWDERFAEMKKHYPDIKADQYHIDILTAHFVRHPDWFDVVVASNLFGDILSDLGPACTGTIGIAPSGNINPERDFPSMFEPVHGSAPDIAGQGIANPIGQIWSAAMMLGTAGNLLVPEPPRTDKRLFNTVHVTGQRLSLGGVMAGGAVHWFLEMLGSKDSELLPALEQEAKQVLPGAEGLIFLPYLMGERTPIWDSSARGAFVGLSSRHQRGHLYRSLGWACHLEHTQ